MKYAVTLAAVAAAGLMLGTAATAQDKQQIAFVVNGASDFWKLAEAGVAKAQAEMPDYEMSLKYPEQAAAAIQQRLLDDLVAAGTDAIMVSAIDPATSTEALNRIAGQVPLLTADSDAPQSDRLAYIGSSNTDLGRDAGKMMVEAMPDGGKCMGFVGLLGADNARERIEGFNEATEGTNVELVDVRGDDIDMARARANVDDVLVANPEINCMVGFYSYNPPRIYEALRDAGKLGEITVVAFDEDPITLGAVREGSFYGTVVQQPFEWGYQGMKMLAATLEGNPPAEEINIIPGKVITQENVDQFEADLKAAIGG